MKQAINIRLYLLGAMLIWSSNAPVLKSLLTVLDGNIILFSRAILAAVSLLIFRVKFIPKKFPSFSLYEILIISLCGFLYIYVQLKLHIEGLKYVTATFAIMLCALAPFVAMPIESFCFARKIRTYDIVSTCIAIFGLCFAIRPNLLEYGTAVGCSLILAALLTANFGNVIIQKLSMKYSTLDILIAVNIVGCLFFLIEAFVENINITNSIMSLNINDIALLFTFSILSGGICSIIWFNSILKIGLLEASLYLLFVPIFGMLVASYYLNETFAANHMVGLVAVLTGTFLATPIVKTKLSLIQHSLSDYHGSKK